MNLHSSTRFGKFTTFGKEKLDTLGPIKKEDYSELLDIQQLRPQGATFTTLTPEAFKKCILHRNVKNI